MMDDVHSLAAAYAINAVDGEERQAFETHLPTCAECQEVVTELSETAALLSVDTAVEPSPELRVRVLELVAAEARADTGRTQAPATGGTGEHRTNVSSLQARRERKLMPGQRWLAGVAAAGIVAAGIWGVTQGMGPDPIEQIVSAEDAAQYTADSENGTVVVVTSAGSGQAVLQLPEGMPAPQDGSVYQAWFVHEDGTARSAGVLSEEAVAEHTDMLEGSPEGAVAVGLTVEPAGGSDAPTSEPFVVVPLG